MANKKTAPVSGQETRRFIVLAAGQSSPQMFPVAKVGVSGLSGLFLRRDEPNPVVPDDSADEGVGESLAESLVDRGLCVYVDAVNGSVTSSDSIDHSDPPGPPAE